MQNGTGNDPNRSTHPSADGTPEGGIVVFAGDRTQSRPARLNSLTDGTPVIAAGVTAGIRMHGTPDEPRATFILIAADGAATYAAVDTETYDHIFGYLLEQAAVSLHGIARRPFEDGPPYIQVTEVEPLFD